MGETERKDTELGNRRWIAGEGELILLREGKGREGCMGGLGIGNDNTF